MRIRNKILLYFSTTVIGLTIISSIIIYVLFAEYREEEFHQRQKEKIKHTIELIAEYKKLSEKLISIMDTLTIYDFYDEKMLIYDKDKNLIYKSIDDLPIANPEKFVNDLSPANQWIKTKQGKYDVVAVYIQNDDTHFYAISKAYDAYGYTKLSFLRNVLIGIAFIISIIVFIVTLYLAKRISEPITNLAEKLTKLDLSKESIPDLQIESNTYELTYLIQKFNELIHKTNEAFLFQKHTIQHISHQLKTPVAILVSELERIQTNIKDKAIKSELDTQIVKAKSLGNTINVLLEISKFESGREIPKEYIRIDELFFDIIAELSSIYPDFHFEVNYLPKEFDEQNLSLHVNSQLITQAIQNILLNCISYSDRNKADIVFNGTDSKKLKIIVANIGSPITAEEEKFLFRHFFRGKNSQNKTGFGLGLVLCKKIFELHNATITYSNTQQNLNVFEINFLLS